MTKHLSVLFIILSICLFNSCKSKDLTAPGGKVSLSNELVVLNPNGDAPLTAYISFTTAVQTKISVQVVGKNGSASDVDKDFDSLSTTQVIPVLGLYPNYNNTVIIIFKNASGTEMDRKSYSIQTAALPAGIFPVISIDTKQTGMADGMTLVSYFGNTATSATPQFPFMFDAFGDIRWYLDVRTSTVLNNLFFDVGLARLQDGNLYFGDINSNAVYELDMLGKIINTWTFPAYQFHHNVLEKPNGNFLVTVSKKGASTVEDYVIELDRNSKDIIRTWNLQQSLQYGRRTLTGDSVDWIHVNGLVYDPSDSCIIISGRTQAVVKLDQNNNVVWILGCHTGWGISGNGVDLNNYLLQPLDINNTPITDTNVLDGNTNATDFEWNWYQHAPSLMPNGDIMLFDNGGGNRNFTGISGYSRAVEFNINKTNKTVKQIWTYGKSRGTATRSNIVSNVNFISSVNHVIFCPGAVDNTTNYGKVIELDYATQNIFFEATLTPADAYYGITFHRTYRLSLYP